MTKTNSGLMFMIDKNASTLIQDLQIDFLSVMKRNQRLPGHPEKHDNPRQRGEQND